MKKSSFSMLGIFLQLSLIADYSYDANGNVASIFMPENGQVNYQYDPITLLFKTALFCMLYPMLTHPQSPILSPLSLKRSIR